MPYTIDNLPDAVKVLPDESKRQQWLAAFNDAFDKCNSGGGTDCDASASMQAWGTVNKALAPNKNATDASPEALTALAMGTTPPAGTPPVNPEDVKTGEGAPSDGKPPADPNATSITVEKETLIKTIQDTLTQLGKSLLSALGINVAGKSETGDEPIVAEGEVAVVPVETVPQALKANLVPPTVTQKQATNDAPAPSAAAQQVQHLQSQIQALQQQVQQVQTSQLTQMPAYPRTAGTAPTGEPVKRALSLAALSGQVNLLVQQQDPSAMIYDIYIDKDGGVFFLCSSNGKLAKVGVTIADDTVTLGKWEDVAVTRERNDFSIKRETDGNYRWIAISGSSVLNKDGQIDSRELFDDFVKRADETGNYPIRTFFHAGEKLRTGQCDFIARDDNLLITSGLYDNSELALREIRSRLAHPDQWGDSINFLPTIAPTIMRVGGIDIPVYRRGMLCEISTLPETDAASHFTVMPTLREVHRMLSTKRQYDAFLLLFDGDQKLADEWLEKHSATRNTNIVDASMISRAQADLTGVLKGDEIGADTTDVPSVPVQAVQAVQQPVQAVQKAPDASIEQLRALTATVTDTFGQLNVAMTELASRLASFEKNTANLDLRLRAVETPVEERIAVAVQDTPPHVPQTRSAYKPRDLTSRPLTYAEVAEDTLNKINF